MDFKDQHFQDATVTLDGNTFTNCTFRDVTLVYGGGDLVIPGCNFGGHLVWTYTGDMARGFTQLASLYNVPVENITEAIVTALNGSLTVTGH